MDLLIAAGIAAIVIVAIACVWRALTPLDPSPSTTTADDRADGPTTTMFDRVGADLIRSAVDQFYHRVLGDPRLGHYFTGIDLSRLRRHQALLIGQILGGPVHFQLHQLEAIHRRFCIDRDTYWAAAMHLVAVMATLGAPRDVQVHLFGALWDLQGQIVVDQVRRRS